MCDVLTRSYKLCFETWWSWITPLGALLCIDTTWWCMSFLSESALFVCGAMMSEEAQDLNWLTRKYYIVWTTFETCWHRFCHIWVASSLNHSMKLPVTLTESVISFCFSSLVVLGANRGQCACKSYTCSMDQIFLSATPVHFNNVNLAPPWTSPNLVKIHQCFPYTLVKNEWMLYSACIIVNSGVTSMWHW